MYFQMSTFKIQVPAVDFFLLFNVLNGRLLTFFIENLSTYQIKHTDFFVFLYT